MSGFAPGTYYGLTAEDYNTLITNETLASFLQSNFSSVADGAFYVYTGSDEDMLDFFDLMETAGADTSLIQYFVFAKSTWSIGGF